MSEPNYRAVLISDAQVTFLEELGYALMRAGDNEAATILLGMVLVWSVAPDDGTIPESNVIELHGPSRKVGA